LELRVRKLLKERYGRKSEKVSSEQLSLFLGLLGEGDDETTEPPEDDDKASEESDDDEPRDAADKTPRKKRRRATPHGRRPLPANLPREEVTLPVAHDERVCERCGDDKGLLGHERSEVLEFVPGHFKVVVYLREKLACKRCGDGVVIGPVADKVIEGGLPGPGLLAEVVVNKYRDHLPLYRQVERFKRLGVELPRSTLSDWIGSVAGELAPIVAEIERQVLASYVVQTDSTGPRHGARPACRPVRG